MRKFKCFKCFSVGIGKPRKYAWNHDQTYKEEGHDIYTCHDPKFS